jgi:hypothetical protein
VAIEIDRDLAARLRERYAPDELELVVGDALEVDLASLGTDLRVVGNLPYNISSPILFHLAAQAHALRDLTVMLQKEVVARMTAEPGTAEYGRLTVMLEATFAIERCSSCRRARSVRRRRSTRPSRVSCRSAPTSRRFATGTASSVSSRRRSRSGARRCATRSRRS